MASSSTLYVIRTADAAQADQAFIGAYYPANASLPFAWSTDRRKGAARFTREEAIEAANALEDFFKAYYFRRGEATPKAARLVIVPASGGAPIVRPSRKAL